MVKGYKVFNHDWTCNVRGNVKQYACPGKFEEDVQPIVCKSGMHFCKKAVDCFNYHVFDPSKKVAEVIAYGKISEFDDKCCTDKLEIVREISWEELLMMVNMGGCTYKQKQEWWDKLLYKEKEIIKSIPNFDATIFKQITGIDVNA